MGLLTASPDDEKERPSEPPVPNKAPSVYRSDPVHCGQLTSEPFPQSVKDPFRRVLGTLSAEC